MLEKHVHVVKVPCSSFCRRDKYGVSGKQEKKTIKVFVSFLFPPTFQQNLFLGGWGAIFLCAPCCEFEALSPRHSLSANY